MQLQREYGTRIMALSDDYLNVTEITYEWEYFAESPAMLKQNGYYFIFGSHLTGWDANDNVLFPTTAPQPCTNAVNRSTATPNLCLAPGQNGLSSHPKDQRPSSPKSATSNHSATTTQSTSATDGFLPISSPALMSGYPSKSKAPK